MLRTSFCSSNYYQTYLTGVHHHFAGRGTTDILTEHKIKCDFYKFYKFIG